MAYLFAPPMPFAYEYYTTSFAAFFVAFFFIKYRLGYYFETNHNVRQVKVVQLISNEGSQPEKKIVITL